MKESTLSFAFFAGTVATVNPCGFALLPAYIGRRIRPDDGSTSSADAIARALLVGAVTTAGVLLVFVTLGSAISLGAHAMINVFPWLGLALGAALIVAGAATFAHKKLRVPLAGLRPRLGDQPTLTADLLFGIGYGTTSLSCTLPIFLAATGHRRNWRCSSEPPQVCRLRDRAWIATPWRRLHPTVTMKERCLMLELRSNLDP